MCPYLNVDEKECQLYGNIREYMRDICQSGEKYNDCYKVAYGMYNAECCGSCGTAMGFNPGTSSGYCGVYRISVEGLNRCKSNMWRRRRI